VDSTTASNRSTPLILAAKHGWLDVAAAIISRSTEVMAEVLEACESDTGMNALMWGEPRVTTVPHAWLLAWRPLLSAAAL
jgi:hypothetical protein